MSLQSTETTLYPPTSTYALSAVHRRVKQTYPSASETRVTPFTCTCFDGEHAGEVVVGREPSVRDDFQRQPVRPVVDYVRFVAVSDVDRSVVAEISVRKRSDEKRAVRKTTDKQIMTTSVVANVLKSARTNCNRETLTGRSRQTPVRCVSGPRRFLRPWWRSRTFGPTYRLKRKTTRMIIFIFDPLSISGRTDGPPTRPRFAKVYVMQTAIKYGVFVDTRLTVARLIVVLFSITLVRFECLY